MTIRREHQKYPLRTGDAAQVGLDSSYLDEITLLNDWGIKIGDRVSIGARCWLNGFGGIVIGSDTMIGPGVFVHSANHKIVGGIVDPDEWDERPVTIGQGCWIGAGSIVLPGATLDDGCVVGAGSVLHGHYSGVVFGPKAREMETA
jgi:acetyltransferase-like isoleucine patch superfamily enzyme